MIHRVDDATSSTLIGADLAFDAVLIWAKPLSNCMFDRLEYHPLFLLRVRHVPLSAVART